MPFSFSLYHENLVLVFLTDIHNLHSTAGEVVGELLKPDGSSRLHDHHDRVSYSSCNLDIKNHYLIPSIDFKKNVFKGLRLQR